MSQLGMSSIPTGRPKTLHYKRSNFSTQLPVDYSYSPSHFWIARMENGLWRVGFTKFAVRMLGESVDCEFVVEKEARVHSGQVIGWIEGFKAISDIYCVADGRFSGGSPTLKENIKLVHKDPYGAGWLYELNGTPDSKCIDIHGYCQVLDQSIDRILEKQKEGKSHE